MWTKLGTIDLLREKNCNIFSPIGGGAAAEQQFCLKWNNHRSTILSVFDALLEEESLIDVTLWTGPDNPVVRAHRIVLSACSPYFRVSTPNII